MPNTQRFMLVVVTIAWGSPDCFNNITEFIGKFLYMYVCPKDEALHVWEAVFVTVSTFIFCTFLFTTQRCAVDNFLNQMTNSLVRQISFEHTIFYNYTCIYQESLHI